MPLAYFPALDASLNAASALLLLSGWLFIRRGKVDAHRACMGAAFVCSSVFLVCYLNYHYHVGSMHFRGHGLVRRLYFAILSTHTALAGLIVPLILRTFYLALKGRFEEHKWWAKRTLPLWLYVSVTGVIIYEMLYRLY